MIEYGYEIDPKGNRLQQILDRFPDMNASDLRAIEGEARERGDKFLADEAQGEITYRNRIVVPWTENDGGRSKYFKGKNAGDCVVRAIAIASERDYKEVYDDLAKLNQKYDRSRKRSARNGVNPKAYKYYFGWSLNWTWYPTMEVGSGCQVHLRPDELPSGRIVCRLSKHLVAVIDGVIHDTYDSSRDGTRCVYGYWKKED
jgi:hypothetical protein